jgi:condensin complex subunit 1
MDSLDGVKYREKEIDLKLFLIENASDELKNARIEAVQGLDQTSTNYKSSLTEIDNAFIKAVVESVDGNGSNSDSELFTKVQAYKFVDSAISFINLFESADETFRNLLLSSNSSDVVEALRFFVQANHFNMPFSIRGIKEALCLMWSTDVNIQEEVLNSFVSVFITVPGTEQQEFLPSKKIAQNLTILVSKSNASEVASIEQAISRLVRKELIPSEVFSILWSIAAKAPSRHARAAAMLLISMGATSDSSIVDSASRLRHLLEAGLGDYTEEHRDWLTAKAAATALQRVKMVSTDRLSAKYVVTQLIIERLLCIIKGSWCLNDLVDDTKLWFGAAEQAINAIFVLCDQPEKTCKEVISSMEAATFGFGSGRPRSSCHSLQLSRFFFVISHIALKLLVYTESLSGSIRRAKAAMMTASHEESLKVHAVKSTKKGEAESVTSIESELGLAQAEEAEAESKIAEISDKEIIGRGIIGLFAPLVVRVVADTSGVYKSEILMQTSTLAMCKFMCISGSFCSKYFPLLFRTMTITPTDDVTLRANTVIALGDLAFRFPNEFEPYTSHLYACLRDKSTRVRRHSLMVLTHLILNDMIKCKGQVCEIALCLQDKETPIRDMARLLFNELSKRSNNPIYNLLPDIISRLSVIGVKKDDFRKIMTFLLSFIKKDKQNETLVDKLCQRFSKCTSLSETADISFCITQLKMNEKCVKILLDHFKSYKDSLFDEDVYKNFVVILSKLKKLPGLDAKDALVEWENRMKECRSAGIEDNIADRNAESMKGKKKKTKNRIV